MAEAMQGLMDAIEARMKKKGFETKRAGNRIDVEKFPAAEKPKKEATTPQKAKSKMRTIPIDGGTVELPEDEPYGLERPMKKGGAVKKYAMGGSVKSSASKRADGCAQRGKTKGKML